MKDKYTHLHEQGKATMLFRKKVEPVFKAARCTYDVICEHSSGCSYFLVSFRNLLYPDTKYRNHATEIARDLPLGEFDAVVMVSGDGVAHEVLNGLAQHQNPRAALRTPIAPIPAGSGNGLSLNLLGLEVRLPFEEYDLQGSRSFRKA